MSKIYFQQWTTLHVDSELQVFDAADSWLCHDITERSKYAKSILSKVRLSLLSVPALKQVLDNVSSKYPECSNIIEAVLNNKQQLNSTRYCNQANFNILVCGGKNVNLTNVSNDVIIFNADNFSEVNSLPHMREARYFFGAICIKMKVYVFGGFDRSRKQMPSVEKYSRATNT